jgi:restriction system protein
MTVPDYQTLMLPLLKFAADEKEHRVRDAVEYLSNEFHLSSEDRESLLPSGKQTFISSRVQAS